MHSALQRLNVMSSQISAALLVMAVLLGVSGYNALREPVVSLDSARVIQLVPDRRFYKADTAVMRVSFEADLTPLFNWNTRVVFAYLTAHYSTPSRPENSVVVWDHILTKKEEAKITVHDAQAKYFLRDVDFELRNANVTFTLHYDVMPHTGLIFTSNHGELPLQVPAEYVMDRIN